jgi:prepilin-type N-terminal cleavage/methylation domain-containing protein
MIARFRTARRDEQAGFTLVELLVTVTIMSLAFVVILGAIAVFMRTTSVHRTSADLDGAMRTYVERLDAVTYTPCATTYAVPAANLPAGFLAKFQPTVTAKYWDGNPSPAAYGTSCTAPTDKGAQQLTVTVRRVSNGQQDTLVVVKRQS